MSLEQVGSNAFILLILLITGLIIYAKIRNKSIIETLKEFTEGFNN